VFRTELYVKAVPRGLFCLFIFYLFFCLKKCIELSLFYLDTENKSYFTIIMYLPKKNPK